MRVLAPLITLVLVAVTLAGCVSDPAPAAEDAPVFAQASPHIVPSGLALPSGVLPNVHSTQVSNGAEPVVLAKRDGSVLLVADLTGVYRSTDNGQTWLHVNYLIGNFALADGWAVAEDDAGNLYAAGLAEARLHVARSVSGGQSWDLTSLVPDTLGAIPDRPWIAAQGDAQVALIYNDSGFMTRCMMSYDGGVTWPDIRPSSGAPIAGGVVFSDGVLYFTGPTGQVYRANPTAPLGGVVPRHCQNGALFYDLWPYDLGATGQLQVAAEDGASYIAVPTGDNLAVAVSGTSTYTGTPRSIIVSPPGLQSNTFTTISIQDGRIAVSWLGSTTAGNPTATNFAGSWNVYLAVIEDFWGASPVVDVYQVTSSPNHVGNICLSGLGCSGAQDRDLLDYMGSDVGPDGRVHLVWTDDTATSTRVMYGSVTPS